MSNSENAPGISSSERRRRAKEKLLFASASVLLMKQLIGRTAWLKLIRADLPGRKPHAVQSGAEEVRS